MKRILNGRMAAALLLPLLLILLSCNDEGTGTTGGDDPAGSVSAVVGCKGNSFMPEEGSTSEGCVVHTYDAGKRLLTLKHVNAGFNCCPERIDAIVTVEGGTITISERESNAPCDCNCLYDIDIVISNLDVGEYLIRFVEPYRSSNDPPLEVTVDLSAQPTGRHCVERSYYPWGL